MLSNEDVRMTCPKCNGLGQVGNLIHKEQIYKITCPKCFGQKKIDWIWNVMHHEVDAFVITFMIKTHMEKDNYVFVFGGTTYFITKGFFDPSLTTREQYKHFVMHVPYLRDNPGTLDMWRD